MDKQRFEQRKQDFSRAASRLDEAARQTGDDILRDAVIQRFEFTFEAAWKVLQMYLQYQGLEAAGPRGVIKQAFVQGLIATPEDADIWLSMLEDRNLTTHTYREELAEAIAGRVRLHYARALSQMAFAVSGLALD